MDQPTSALKWVNRFAPLYIEGKISKKICDLPMKTIVEVTGATNDLYEEVSHCTIDGVVVGWVHTDDLEDYVRNFPFNVVKIENQTPDLHDFEQYIIFHLNKQVNMCGELCVSHALGISLGTMLTMWELKVPSFFKRVFGNGKARGTGSGELTEMLSAFGQKSESLATALYQPHIKRARYTIKALNKLLAHGSVIVSIHISGSTGLIQPSGVLHWVTLKSILSERNGQGMVMFFNPAMNCIESCSWNEFVTSAGNPYGAFNPNVGPIPGLFPCFSVHFHPIFQKLHDTF